MAYVTPWDSAYPGVSEGKQWDSEHGCYIRKRDCDIAIKYLGYKWYKVNKKTDFSGASFFWVLWNGKPDANYILEPDTTVPNSSNDLSCALVIARIIGIESIPVLETDEKMARWINDRI